MASSRNHEPRAAPPRRRDARRFTPDALARVLSADLGLTPDSPLYVAYSGGMDSHVLLHAAARLRARAPWRVAALHVDHDLQPDSGAWARHCAAVCAALAVPLQSQRVAVTGIAERGLEDAARRARYEALARLLPAGAVLLTAHHRNDQAETVLLQLLRGTGVPGLAAMPAIGAFARGRLARPLLGFDRAALAAYARAQGLAWIEDGSNRDTGPARNYLRAEVWSKLVRRWPGAAGQLAAAARHQAEAAGLLEELAHIDLAAADAGGALRIDALEALARPRRANLVRYWLRRHGVPVPGERVLRELLARIAAPPQTRHAAVRWNGGEVRRYRDRLILVAPESAPPPDWRAPWDPGTVLEIPGAGRLRARPATGAGLGRAHLDARALEVRLRHGGERCRLRGHRRSVKKLLQEAGIPPWERARLPFVYVDGELAAIGDRWVCEPYAARAGEPGLVLVLER